MDDDVGWRRGRTAAERRGDDERRKAARGDAETGATPLHLVCRLQWKRLRAWKKRSLQTQFAAGGRIRPQAYSSSSAGFCGFLDPAHPCFARPVVLWIVTSYALPGRRRRVPSLAATVHVRAAYRGDDPRLPRDLARYVVRWKTSDTETRPHRCIVAEADRTVSRFFPANDMTACLSRLHYVNRDGGRTAYSPRRVLRVRPGDVPALEAYADAVARHTVFISYKHADFAEPSAGDRPPWTVMELAEAFIADKLGVWLDALCAPPGAEESPRDLDADDVTLLLQEGHAQSAVVVGIDTENYLTPGEDGHNWTRAEYEGSVDPRHRDAPLRRFALYGDAGTRVTPAPDAAARWSEDLGARVVPRVRRLVEAAVTGDARGRGRGRHGADGETGGGGVRRRGKR